MSSSDEVVCPECGGHLLVEIVTKGKKDEVVISIGCEGVEDDEFEVEVSTGLDEDDFSLLKKGDVIKMTGRVVKRRRDHPEADDEGKQ